MRKMPANLMFAAGFYLRFHKGKRRNNMENFQDVKIRLRRDFKAGLPRFEFFKNHISAWNAQDQRYVFFARFRVAKNFFQDFPVLRFFSKKQNAGSLIIKTMEDIRLGCL